MRFTGAQLLLEGLKQENVTTIFGYPGGALLPIYDALITETNIKHILVRHEQAAAHAADGYARATGKVGVCMATSGPGATNLVTGIATAYLDSVPLVAITGQADSNQIGKDAFQWVSITNITLPITKNNYLIKDIKDIVPTVKEAFKVARSNRPGPVLIDLPRDIAASAVEYTAGADIETAVSFPQVSEFSFITNAIKTATKPLLIVGGGVVIANAHEELKRLVEQTRIPVMSTLMGKSAFPNTHQYYLGWGGMNGSTLANYAMQEADLLICIGLRFDERFLAKGLDESVKNKKIIHIDIDAAEINKLVKSSLFIVADAKLALQHLLDELRGYSLPQRSSWHMLLSRFSERNLSIPLATNTKKLSAPYVMQTLNALLDGTEIVVTDTGQHQIWAAQFLDCIAARQFLTSGGDGAMGFGLPAAIGAYLGRPDKQVICITGDGSLQMSLPDLATVVANNCPVKIFIFNNNSLGMIRQLQETLYNRRHAVADLQDSNPNFSKIAAAYRVPFFSIDKIDEVKTKLLQALKHDGPIIVDIKVDAAANVGTYTLQRQL